MVLTLQDLKEELKKIDGKAVAYFSTFDDKFEYYTISTDNEEYSSIKKENFESKTGNQRGFMIMFEFPGWRLNI